MNNASQSQWACLNPSIGRRHPGLASPNNTPTVTNQRTEGRKR